jgi:hypothetical protein
MGSRELAPTGRGAPFDGKWPSRGRWRTGTVASMAAQVQFFDGRRYRGVLLGDDPVVVGGRTTEIRVPGTTVTQRHARFFCERGRVWIEDLGGDGVWVNGRKIDRCALANRDRVQVGTLALEFFED